MYATVVTAKSLGKELGISANRVRRFLRSRHPAMAPGPGARWQLSAEQVDEVRRYFTEHPPRFPRREGAETAIPTDWFWEGAVQDRVVSYLQAEGWSILRTADTGRRARGVDIEATKRTRRLLVEVKGYPSVGYRDARRAAEFKPTNPSVQARHWFAQAVFKSMSSWSSESDCEIAIALPAMTRYESLAASVRPALGSLGIGIYLVDESDTITVLLPHLKRKPQTPRL